MTHSPKLLLFDIDGTLVSCGGAGKRAMLAAADDVLKKPLRHDFLRFAGMTDRWILQDLLRENGFPESEEVILIDRILEKYTAHLRMELSRNGSVAVLPGVAELLAKTRENGFYCGLVTGNIRSGAAQKLGAVRLFEHFQFGAFGDDAIQRNLLPPLAVERAKAHTRMQFDNRDIWVIGDTPRDIECGKINGFRTLAVATGGADFDTLKAHQPDALLADFSDVSACLAVFGE